MTIVHDFPSCRFVSLTFRFVPKEAMPEVWEESLEEIKQCCLRNHQYQTPALMNRLGLKRLRFLKLDRCAQSEVILDLMRCSRNLTDCDPSQIQRCLIAQFPFCVTCARRIYGLSPYRWNVYNNLSLRNPNIRRSHRRDIDNKRDTSVKSMFFNNYLQTLMVWGFQFTHLMGKSIQIFLKIRQLFTFCFDRRPYFSINEYFFFFCSFLSGQ